MKKLNKLLIGLSIPTTAMAILPLVSCGNPATPITPTVTKGIHVKDVKVSEIKMNNPFTVELVSSDTGWRKIDANKTTILVNDKPVAFTVLSNIKIEVKGSDVTHDSIKINVEADKTINTIWGGFNTTSEVGIYNLHHVGEKIELTTDETQPKGIEAWLLYGTYFKEESKNDWREVQLGSGDNQYSLLTWKEGKQKEDITDSFKSSGYTFTDDDLNKTSAGLYKPTPFHLEFDYHGTDGGTTVLTNWQTSCLVVRLLVDSECKIEPEKASIKKSEGTTDFIGTVNEGALNSWSYEIQDKGTATDVTMDEYGKLIAGSLTGTVTVKGTTLDKVSGNPITKTTTVTITD